MDQIRCRRRRYLREAGGVVGLTGTVGSAGCLRYVRSVEVDGVVGAKFITGRRNTTVYPVLAVHEIALLVKDERFEEYFSDQFTVIVDDDLHRELELAYWDGVSYLIQMHLRSDDSINQIHAGEARSYVCARNTFNELQVGAHVSFEVSRHETLSITRVRDRV